MSLEFILYLMYIGASPATYHISDFQDGSQIIDQMKIDQHGSIPVPNICVFPDPPYFSLITTLKKYYLSEKMHFANS